jgi:hypothetical protein
MKAIASPFETDALGEEPEEAGEEALGPGCLDWEGVSGSSKFDPTLSEGARARMGQRNRQLLEDLQGFQAGCLAKYNHRFFQRTPVKSLKTLPLTSPTTRARHGATAKIRGTKYIG